MARRLFVSAGEPSGDIHAANLILALKRQSVRWTTVGFGGPRMQSAGCRLLYPLAEHPIMGLAGAICSLPLMRRLLAEFGRELDSNRPDAVVLVDYPGFHLRLAKLARQRGIPVFYHVPPQFWAWGSWRVKQIAQYVDGLYCSLPFEETWYRGQGVHTATYIGHPFFDDLPDHAATLASPHRATVDSSSKQLVLLPGSRLWEAKRNARILLDAAAILRKRMDRLQIHVAAFNDAIGQYIRSRLDERHGSVSIHVQHTRELLASADAAIAVSGSVSLELLHFEVPSVIVYSIPWHWNYLLKPLLLHTPYVSLVNLIAGRAVFPEFIGSRLRGGDIADSVARLLSSTPERESVRRTLGRLRHAYGEPGASAAAAEHLLKRLSDTETTRQVA